MSSQRSFFFFSYKEAIDPCMFRRLGSQVAGVGHRKGSTPAQLGTDLDLPGMVENNQAQQDDGGEADEAFECK